MKKDPILEAFRSEVWAKALRLPVTYSQYTYDDDGKSSSGAVASLIDQLTEMHIGQSAADPKKKPYGEADVQRIVGQIKGYLDTTLGKIHSYDARVRAYLLEISTS